MQFNQASARGQGGFTLIELIVVIVILGILAATALPKFSDLGSDARRAKMQAARGSVNSAVALAKSQFLVNGMSAAGNVTLEGTSYAVGDKGYPTSASIAAIAGIDATADYTVSGTTTVTISDARKTTCSFTYDPATGTTTAVASTAGSC
jgi:MSHA pilin protein MshA